MIAAWLPWDVPVKDDVAHWWRDAGLSWGGRGGLSWGGRGGPFVSRSWAIQWKWRSQ